MLFKTLFIIIFLGNISLFSSPHKGECVGNCENGKGKFSFDKSLDEFEGNFQDSELVKRMNREMKINSLIETPDVDETNSIFTNLIEYFESEHQVLDDTLYNLIHEFVFENEFDEQDN